MTTKELKRAMQAGAKTAADGAKWLRARYIIGYAVGDVYRVKKDGTRVKINNADYQPLGGAS